MGKLRGRKSNPAAKSRQTTREGRGTSEVPQVQPMLRKLDAAELQAEGNARRLAKILAVRAALQGFGDEARRLWAELEEIEGRTKRTERAGFVRASTAGRMSADRIRGEIQVLESRARNTLALALREFGLRAADAGYPIDMLRANGDLVGEGEESIIGDDRCEIGAYFASLHWRLYGLPAQAQSFGYVAPLNAEEMQAMLERSKRLEVVEPLTGDERAWLDQARYTALRDAVRRRGREVEAVVLATCCHLAMPRGVALPVLRRGLEAMCEAREDLPGRGDIPARVRLAS